MHTHPHSHHTRSHTNKGLASEIGNVEMPNSEAAASRSKMQPREAATSRSEMQQREVANQQPVVTDAIVRSQAIGDRRCQRSSGEQIGDATARSSSQQIGDATAWTSSHQSPTRSCKAKPSLQPRRADGIYCTSTATACCHWLHRLPQPLQLNSPPHSLSPSF